LSLRARDEKHSEAISLIGLPYIFGTRQPSPQNHMALGPGALLSNGLLKSSLAERFVNVEIVMIDDADDPRPEGTMGYSSFNVAGLFAGDQLSRMLVQNSRLAQEVHRAREAGRIPLAATGGCSAALGMVAGLGVETDIGMIWFDAHHDANTPETSASGLVEAMAVAMVAGRCWSTYCQRIPGFRAIPMERILSIGLHEDHVGRDKRSQVLENVVDRRAIREQGLENTLTLALEHLAERCSSVYIHVDVDVLDPSALRASNYMVCGGLTVEQLHLALSAVARRFKIIGLDYSAFDPSLDETAADILAKSMVRASVAMVESLKHRPDLHSAVGAPR